jgi:hypothetical protein
MTRESIIRQIVELDLAGRRLLDAEIAESNEQLHKAAVEEFGSWETALEYSGINVFNVSSRKDLTPDRVRVQLRRLCTTGYDLRAKVNRSRDRALYNAALRHFGSWRAALEVAGVNLKNVSNGKPKHLSREAMIHWLQNRRSAGQTLMFRDVCLENRDHAMAIRREFGSWIGAIRVAFENDSPEN